jgi:FAD synthetase
MIMKKVMIFGTFDIFHEGHKNFFRQAREYGNYLVVVVAKDENVLKVKNKLPRNDEKERLKKIKESELADEVVLGDLVDKYKIIKKHKPKAICLGYDQKVSVSELKKKLAEFGLGKTEIIRLKSFHPEIYKSSKLENMQKKRQNRRL